VRSLDAAEPRLLAGTDGAQSPFWSPDGRDLGFFADGQLKRISLSGGSSQALAPVLLPLGGAWSRDGFILYVGSRSAGVQRIAATGGESICLVDTSRSATVRELGWPEALPGGRHFLFATASSSIWQGTQDGVYVAPVNGREKPRLLLPGAMRALYAKPGRLFFWRDGALWAQTFDAGRLKLAGAAVQVAERVALDPTRACGMFSASADGRLVYMQGSSAGLTELAWMDRAGRDLGVLTPPGSYYAPRLSHDGRRVAVDRSDVITDQGDIWIFDVARKLGDRLTSSPLNETGPIWSPDDSHLYWMSAVGAAATGDIHRQALGGVGTEETVLKSDKITRPADFTPDGRTLLFVRRDLDVGRNSSLMLFSLADGKTTPWSSSTANESAGRLSNDGRWIAYASNESGQNEVYVQRFPERGERWRVSTSGGITPIWRGDGREIYYVVQDRQVMAVPFRAEPTVEIGLPVSLFRVQLQPGGSTASYDITADGQRFLVDRQLQAQGRTSLTLDQGWMPPR
jgi:dipeptidyl aminopeptidase/acylaminoacyl peptidase